MHEARKSLWFDSQKTILTFAAMLIFWFFFLFPSGCLGAVWTAQYRRTGIQLISLFTFLCKWVIKKYTRQSRVWIQISVLVCTMICFTNARLERFVREFWMQGAWVKGLQWHEVLKQSLRKQLPARGICCLPASNLNLQKIRSSSPGIFPQPMLPQLKYSHLWKIWDTAA